MTAVPRPYSESYIGNMTFNRYRAPKVAVAGANPFAVTWSTAATAQITAGTLKYAFIDSGGIVLRFNAMPLLISDATTNGGNGNMELFTFPAMIYSFEDRLGRIQTTAGDAGGATFGGNVVFGLGTAAAAADATLTGTEVDLFSSFAVATTAGVGSGTLYIDTNVKAEYTGGTTKCFLNAARADGVADVDGTLLLTGFFILRGTGVGLLSMAWFNAQYPELA